MLLSFPTLSARLRWALWLAVGLILRVLAVPPSVADVDGVNFAKALVAFDPLHQAPHMPGYPVYVAASRTFAWLGTSEVWALVLPGLLTFGIGSVGCALAVQRRFGPAVAETFLAALCLMPGAVLFAAWPTSDGFGLGLALITLGALAQAHTQTHTRRAYVLVGLLAGLTLGARLSWWPLVLVPLLLAWMGGFKPARFIGLGGLLGLCAFTLPLLFWASPSALLEGLLGFTQGHFQEWGGAATTTRELGPRLLTMAWGLGTSLTGVWSPGEAWQNLGVTALALAAAVGLMVRATPPRQPMQVVLLSAAAYLVWVWLGQNVEKPRHLLPLLPLVALGLALGLQRLRIPAWCLAAALGLVCLPRALVQAQPAPAAALAQHVLQNYAPEGLQIFAGEEARVFEHLAPAYRVWRPASPEVLDREARRAATAGVRVLVTSGALGAEAMQGCLTELQRFSTDRAVRAHDHQLVLFTLDDPSRRPHATR